ncbi:glycerol-3-phosphate acyltransferase, chloroplastic-like [Gossypium raimondii]|uniref:glycerol-3-phosphate acyltransferase, chloroplastic-like n=1 Tax=Gossypium raimondii TaxID=29730 RepID=UPI00227CD0DB|nr:glycerol-3-phosphate acyltransferase, chloroplastic-like [Gossypium raimondii]
MNNMPDLAFIKLTCLKDRTEIAVRIGLSALSVYDINSYVGNLSLFYEIEEKLKQGHNVVLISNHHTEADPIIISLLLEKANSHIAENMLYSLCEKTIVSISAGKYWAATATATCGMARKVWKNHILQLGYTELREKRSLKELILRVGHERM